MINKTTVFILGAGASVPFHYPTGFELQEKIKQLLRNVPTRDNVIVNENFPYQPALWNELGFSRERLRMFFDDFSHSATYSIDKFLERRPDHMDLGKLLIAHVLKREEQAHLLHMGLKEDNWYAELANRLDLTADNIGDFRLSFVTFNYDRSLEYFLYYLLKNRTTDIKKAHEAFKKMEIVHVYGGFGNFPWEGGGIPYDYNVTPEILKRFANGIKIMSDERETDELKSAKRLVEKADYIYFIGFGYDEDNLKRLTITFKPSIIANVKGTALGLSFSDRIRLKEYFETITLANPEEGIMKFLDRYVEYC